MSAVQERSDDIISRINRLTADLNELRNEYRARMPGATQAGAITIYDASSNPLLILGLQADGTYGLWALDAAGNVRVKLGQLPSGHFGLNVATPGAAMPMFYVDENGMDEPWMSIPMAYNYDTTPGTNSSPYLSVAAATWTLAGRAFVPLNAWPACRVRVGWGFSDTTTTGQFRVLARYGTGNVPAIAATSNATATLGPNANGTQQLDWLHGQPVGGTGFLMLDIEAQVLSGAGNMLVYPPVVSMLNGTHGATSGGAWSVP